MNILFKRLFLIHLSIYKANLKFSLITLEMLRVADLISKQVYRGGKLYLIHMEVIVIMEGIA